MPNETKSHSITDGFHLVVDALKPNGIDTIFVALASGKPGTDQLLIDPTAGTESGHFQNLNPRSQVDYGKGD